MILDFLFCGHAALRQSSVIGGLILPPLLFPPSSLVIFLGQQFDAFLVGLGFS